MMRMVIDKNTLYITKHLYTFGKIRLLIQRNPTYSKYKCGSAYKVKNPCKVYNTLGLSIMISNTGRFESFQIMFEHLPKNIDIVPKFILDCGDIIDFHDILVEEKLLGDCNTWHSLDTIHKKLKGFEINCNGITAIVRAKALAT